MISSTKKSEDAERRLFCEDAIVEKLFILLSEFPVHEDEDSRELTIFNKKVNDFLYDDNKNILVTMVMKIKKMILFVK